MSVKEFHYIIPLANLESVFEKGILSHNEAEHFKKADVSMDSVQQIRATKDIPAEAMGQARKIHDCANVYFNAKNPMLSSRRSEKNNICVLRLKPDLLALPNAVISDRNAAAKEARFFKAAEGVHQLAMTTLFGKFWTSKYNSPATNELNGHMRCAELLLPCKIHPSYIGGMYVANESVKDAVLKIFPPEKFPQGCPVPISIHPAFFFDPGPDQVQAPLSNTQFASPIAFAEEPVPVKERVIIDLTAEEKAPVVTHVEAVPIQSPAIEPNAPTKSATTPETKPASKSATTTLKTGGLYNWLIQGKSKQDVPKQQDIPKIEKKTIPLPGNITFHKGNLLDSQMQTLVNTVNCKGVMGNGIAEQFKKRFHAMFLDYKEKCDSKSVIPGVPYVFKTADGKLILNFPTKDDWRYDSDLTWIQRGLDHIKSNYRQWGITSLALPPLGCGKGGLDWKFVRRMIIETLGDIDIPIEIYGESGEFK